MDEDGCAVDDGVLVVAGREAAPLLHVAEPAFDHVAVLIVGSIEADRPAADDKNRNEIYRAAVVLNAVAART